MERKYGYILLILFGLNLSVLAVPIANFSVSTTCGSGLVQFNDLSTGAVNATWNFGNGTSLVTISGANPTVMYQKPGIVTVTLTSDDGFGATSRMISSVFVPAIPVFDYGVESVCMSTELAGSVTGINPVQDFSSLNGRYTPIGVGLGSYFNSSTGRITYNIGIGAGTYKIKYAYSISGCNVEYITTGLGIGNASIGPFNGFILTSGECNRIRLVKDITARGSLQWQISNTFTGGAFVDLPSTSEYLHFTNPTNESFLDNYTTPTLTVTSIVRLQLSDLYCGVLDNSSHDQLFTVAGLTKPGTLSTPTPITCQNYSPILSLTGYLGQVNFQYSTDGITYVNSPGGNSFVAQTIPGVVGATFNTVHTPSANTFNTSGNYFFRGLVNYTQYGVLGSCESIYTNVVTISSQFCTVTSAIVNTTTSPICLSNASVPGIFFGSISTITGSVASITGWRWSFGSGATPSTTTTSTNVFPRVRYTSASTPIKNISLTLLGTGFTYITTTTVQVDAFSVQTGIDPPSSNLTICAGNFVTLSVNSTNLSPVIQWQNSPDGVSYTSLVGETNRTYTSPGLSNSMFYRATITNGVCPTVTTPGRSIFVIQPLTISPNFDQPIITICEGNNTTLTATGTNGTIDYLTSSSLTGIYTTVVGISLSNGVLQTDYFNLTGTYYFKARNSNVFNGCSQALSGAYTVSVVSCPILTNFTSSGVSFDRKACLSNSNFTFTDITPTIPGVKFAKWDWNFGSDSNLGILSTTTGNATKSSYSSEGEKIVGLTITAVAGIKTYTGTNFLTLTVDGLSNVSPISATINPICQTSTTGLSFSTTNANPVIRWEQSVAGWNLISNQTTTSYISSPLVSTTGFRVVVTNGVCSSVTSAIVVSTQPSPTSLLLSANVLTVCSGGNKSISISGANYSSVDWMSTPDVALVAFDTVSNGINAHSLVYTTDFLPTGDYFYRAKLNSTTCVPSYSPIVTVTSLDCPIYPVISVTSPYLSQRTCNDQPTFNFKNTTPTISGVRFVKWEWDFDSESNIPSLTTTTGTPTIGINYAIATPNFTNVVKSVSLSITGISGNYTYVGVSQLMLLTIDGVPSVSNFRTLNSQICEGNNNLVLYDNSSPLGAILNWYVSTALGSSFDLLSVSGSNYQQPTTFAGINRFFITADNGVCPTFNSTTTSFVTNTVTSQPIIYAFNYPLQDYCNSVSAVFPNLSTSGTYSGSSFLSNPLGLIISVNGVINPSASIPNEDLSYANYVITYSIPSIGGCLPVSTTTTMTIGKEPTIPVFQYNLNPVCNINGNTIHPIPDASSMNVVGVYSTSITGFPINPTLGFIDLSNLNEGVYTILFSTLAKDGCASKSRAYVLTVSGIPSTPSFEYNLLNCNNAITIPLKSFSNIDFSNPNEGYWKISPTTTGMSIDSTNGSINVSTLSSEGRYNIYYYKYTYGGCSQEKVVEQQPFFLSEIAPTPIIDYGSPFCTNFTNILPLSNSSFSGGYFSTASNVIKFNDPFTGEMQVKEENLTFSGVVQIDYTRTSKNSFICPNVTGSTLVTFTGIPAPVISYDNNFVCNDPTTLIYPSSGVYTVNGYYRARNLASNPLDIDPQTGVITVTSATIQGRYSIEYVTSIVGCAITSATSPIVYIDIQDKADPPFFDYGTDPYCQKTFSPISINGLALDHGFYVIPYSPNSFGIDNNGTVYLFNPSDGVYTIVGYNNSIGIPIKNILSYACPPVSRFAVVTIGSQVNIPNFSYGSSGFFCNDSDFVGPSLTLSGGSFSSNFPGALLLNSITGVIDLKNSIPGTYEVTYSIVAPNACVVEPKKASITIDALPMKQSFTYPQAEYCQGGGLGGIPAPSGSPLPTGGYYSISPLSQSINTLTGIIDLQSIDALTYDIAYISPGKNACPSISSDIVKLRINQTPEVPRLFYGSGGPICINEAKTITAVSLALEGATFTGPDSLNIDATTGTLVFDKLPSSGLFNLYQISVANPSLGNCIGLKNTVIVTITSPVSAPKFDYRNSVYCNSGVDGPDIFTPLIKGGKFYSTTTDLVFENDSLGKINLKKSLSKAPKYFVFYEIPEINGCPAFSSQPDSFRITGPSIGRLTSNAEQQVICSGKGIQIDQIEYVGDSIVWQKREFNEISPSYLKVTKNQDGYFTVPLYDSVYIRTKAVLSGCRDTSSNEIFIRVKQGSKGGIALTREGFSFKEICNELQTELKLINYQGKIQWLFSTDSLRWDDVSLTDTLPRFITPSQNQYGLKQWYRALVTANDCLPDSSSIVLVKVCEKEDFIPNVLTPTSDDGSGNQSTWVIKQLNLRDFAEVRIFNRYGSQVYFANGKEASERPWDGGGLPAGTYYYVIDRKDQTTPLTGSISVIK